MPTLVLIGAIAGATAAQERELQPRQGAELQASYDRIVHEIMSPYCPGRTLAACPSSGAAAMRNEILDWLAAGRSEEWVVEQIVDEWGEQVLGAPRFSGFGSVAWLAAPLLLMAGAAGLGFYLGAERKRSATGVDHPPGSTTDRLPPERRRALEERLERELAMEDRA